MSDLQPNEPNFTNSSNCLSRSIFTCVSSDSGPWTNSSLIWHELMRRIHVNHMWSLANISGSPVSSMRPLIVLGWRDLFLAVWGRKGLLTTLPV